jgi:hypothetical protein
MHGGVRQRDPAPHGSASWCQRSTAACQRSPSLTGPCLTLAHPLRCMMIWALPRRPGPRWAARPTSPTRATCATTWPRGPTGPASPGCLLVRRRLGWLVTVRSVRRSSPPSLEGADRGAGLALPDRSPCLPRCPLPADEQFDASKEQGFNGEVLKSIGPAIAQGVKARSRTLPPPCFQPAPRGAAQHALSSSRQRAHLPACCLWQPLPPACCAEH